MIHYTIGKYRKIFIIACNAQFYERQLTSHT